MVAIAAIPPAHSPSDEVGSRCCRFSTRNLQAVTETGIAADLLDSPTFGLLGLFSDMLVDRNPQGRLDLPYGLNFASGAGTLLSLEQRYVQRIAQMKADVYHWDLLRPSGDLIDWGVLLSMVALARLGYDLARFTGNQITEEQIFLYSLAVELA